MRGAWRRLVELLRPGRMDREAVEELNHHLEQLVERKMSFGLAAPEARREALAEIGAVASARERIAEERTGFAFEQLAREVKYAARILRRSPGLAVLSMLAIGVGIGVSAILFTLVDGIVLRPLPYPEPDRLVRILDRNPQSGIGRAGAASGNIEDWRRRAGVFDGLAGYYAMGRTVSVEGDADVLITAQVSRDFFPVLGVPPVLGRDFSEDETQRAQFSDAATPIGADPVVMLSHRVWSQRFGDDPHVVGRSIVLDRRPFRVVGVMPAGFAMPDGGVDLWIPWNITADHPRDQHYLGAVARLARGVSLGQADDRLNAVARELAVEHPATNRGWGVHLVPLEDEIVGGAAGLLWVLLAAVSLFLLIACASVALLSLIRGLDRREEAAVRLALGATPSRLFREFLFESVLLAAAGGVLGAGIAAAGLRVSRGLTTDLPRVEEVAFDARSMAFIVLVTTLSAILSGLPRALRSRRVDATGGLSTAAGRSTEGANRYRVRDGIVVAHVALAMVLMTGSALLLRSVLQLRATDTGFDPRGVLVAPIFLDSQAYTSGEKTRTYYRALFERLSALPSVVAVGGATTVPTSPLGPDFERPVWPEGLPKDAASVPASVRMVTPGYVPALGLRIVAGRAIDDRDAPQAPRVLMVSETLARRLWPGQDAVGQRLVVDYSTAGTYPYEVVGVVGDIRFRGPRSEPLAEIYIPHAQRSYLILNVVVRATGDPRVLIAPVRAALRSIDPQKPAHGIHTMEDLLGATYARDRQAMVTLLLFAAAAVFLAVLSVYGVLSQRVREREREIGIRMAMGASGSDVILWVAASGLRLIVTGLVAGLLFSRALGRTLEGLLFGVASNDAMTTIGVMAVLGALGLLATLVPSWWATRIDPVRILRRG